MYRALHVDPIIISCGAVYDLPDGRTLWHYPSLDADASEDAQTYRRYRLAQLDLRGHLVCDGGMQALAEMLSQEYTP
jgi:hypothetical protein